MEDGKITILRFLMNLFFNTPRIEVRVVTSIPFLKTLCCTLYFPKGKPRTERRNENFFTLETFSSYRNFPGFLLSFQHFPLLSHLALSSSFSFKMELYSAHNTYLLSDTILSLSSCIQIFA